MKKHPKDCQCCSCKAHRGDYKGKNNGNYKDGRKSAIHECIKGCGNKISYDNWNRGNKRCKSCAHTGILSSTYNKERHIKHFCPDCLKLGIKTEISYSSWKYGNQRCKHCARLLDWQNEEHKNKILKAQRAGMKVYPNKPEKVIKKLLKTLRLRYFCWNRKRIINGFIPDFINKKENKIIELYGDYWHNLDSYKKRDKRRLKEYTKLGYKVLIIWEHELKDINKLINRILKFDRK